MFAGKVVALLLFGLVSAQSFSADQTIGVTRDARNLADWIVDSADHQNLPFIVIDKKEAKVFVYHPDGKLHAATSALMGVTIGDDTAIGVGKKKIADVLVAERTTPAGRFEADLGRDLQKTELLWIDYDSGVSMHVVVTGVASERRLQRLSSEEPAEHRITYGCINVSSKFYRDVVHKTFESSNGIVYILPEVHSIQHVFGPEAARYSLRE